MSLCVWHVEGERRLGIEPGEIIRVVERVLSGTVVHLRNGETLEVTEGWEEVMRDWGHALGVSRR